MKLQYFSRNVILVFLLIFCIAAPQAQGQTGENQENNQENKRILEEVDVTNVVVTVRVQHKNKLVDGLKKEDFILTEDGKEKEVTTFFKEKKKLEIEHTVKQTIADEGVPRRIFVLLFNIADDQINFKEPVDLFFDQVLRPNDRLVIITNKYYIKDHVVLDVNGEKQRLLELLRLETVQARKFKNDMIQTMVSFIKEYNFNNINIRQTDKDPLMRQFLFKYKNYLEEYRLRLFQIDTKDYLELADHLKRQNGEKWILNFYQIARFLQPRPNSDFERGLALRGFLIDLNEVLKLTHSKMSKDIGGLFANTGATCHTLLLKSNNEVYNRDISGALIYDTISMKSEGILKTISNMTGGKVIRSNDTPAFYIKVSEVEDVSYVLSFKSNHKPGKQKPLLQVKVNKPGYHVFYDNQKRNLEFLYAEAKFYEKKKKANPEIRIRNLSFIKGSLNIPIAHYKMVQKGKDKKATVKIRLQVLDKDSKSILDRGTTAELVTDQFEFNIKMNKLKPGKYDVLIMVRDQLTGKEDLAIKSVAI